jgi:hypothetical protein
MHEVGDLFSLLMGCVALLLTREPKVFLLVLVIGIVLAAACWGACSYFSRLWNLSFRLTWTHHLLCGVAAVLTLMATVLYASLKYTQAAALDSIDAWEQQIIHDGAWSNQVFVQAYEAVKRLNIEDFSNYPPPQAGGHTIPAGHEESGKLIASTYANSAYRHFNSHRPFLSAIVPADVPLAKLEEDLRNWFEQHPDSNYELKRAVDLAASEIKAGLVPRTPRVITVARTVVILGLILAQAVPFGLIAHAAYKDIKITA